MKIFLLVFSLFFLTSCTLPNRQLEKQGIMTVSGFDLKDGEGVILTASFLQFDPHKQKSYYVISAEGITSKDARQEMEKKTSHHVSSGQLRAILFQKKLAEEQGLMYLLDTVQRDSNIGSLVHVLIAEDSAENIINASEFEDAQDVGTYIYRMMEKMRIDESLTNTNLHDFMSILYEVGIDPAVPVIKYKEGDPPFIDKTAVFRKDKVVGTISLDETMYIKYLRVSHDGYGMKTIAIPIEKIVDKEEMKKYNHDTIRVSFLPSDSFSKIEVLDKHHFLLEFDIKGNIYEISVEIPLDAKKIKKLEKEINKAMEKELNELLAKLQKLGSDPFGFGRKLKSKREYANLTEKEWYKMYPKIRIDTDINVTIKQYGTVD
ncbi:MAG: Ger(x)C family spore germination protein [Bacillus sp. (in: Bacteria)]|nr:Ger(x)C family spore germination protein [Bacillus sp. (in: firmicutes)]